MAGRFWFTVTVAIVLATAAAVDADNWPGWRGDGRGLSAETDLPETWGPDENVVWKTPIQGNGISSPIVWGDRVFITSAVEDSRLPIAPGVFAGLEVCMIGIALLAVLLTARASRGKPLDARDDHVLQGFLGWVDGVATVVVLLAFVIAMVLLLVAAERVIPAGRIARAWNVTGVCGMLGLIAAVGRFPARSVFRSLGALLLVGAATLFVVRAPLSVFSTPISPIKLAAVAGPLGVAAIWYVAIFLTSFRSDAKLNASNGATWQRSLASMLLIAATGLMFVNFNFLKPQTALQRTIICLDKQTGQIKWKTAGFNWPADKKYPLNSYATPTPVTNGRYVVASYGPGTVCVDMQGKVMWRQMEPMFSKYLRYGAASSPVIHQNTVFYGFMAEWDGSQTGEDSADYAQFSNFAARRLATGDVVWKVCPPQAHNSYDSPVLAHQTDRTVVLMGTNGFVVAYNPDDGSEVWRCAVPVQQMVPSIVVDEEYAYVAGGTHGLKGAVAIKLGGSGDVSKSRVRWQINKRVPECSSPVYYRGMIYWVTEMGVLSCVDASTGDIVWRERINGHYVGSLVAGDGRIYIPADNGDVTVIKAGAEFKQLARNSIGEESGSSPAISSGHFFIRGKQHLFCIGGSRDDKSTPAT